MAVPVRHIRRIPVAAVLGILLATSSNLFNAATASAAALKIQRIRIDSIPDGAAVSTIVGRHGVTPLSITERDIYPNTYPEAKLDLYGKVIISKPGCKTVTRSVTLDDIKQGLDVQLDCTEPAPVASTEAVEKSPVFPKPGPAATSQAEPLSARRLRQLQVLNELLDDGLISAAEERAIRKRLFERLDQD